MSTENLYNKEAKEKIKDLAESIDFTLMATNLGNKPFHTVPMSTKKVDENGNIWFLSGKDTDHNQNINTDNNVQLLYSKPGSMTFLTLYGKAFINTDKTILKELYGKTDDSWFEGVDDPSLCAIQFKPDDAHYWEPKSNKFVSLLKMGVGAITGNEPDISQHGDLKSIH